MKKSIFLYNIILLLSFTLFLSSCNQKNQDKSDSMIIMLSMDGFRWDYPELYDTPNLDRIAEKGVKAEALIPSFPTKTFPNHYSIATGLYPDNHGLVNNTYFDPQRKDFFRLGDREKVEDAHYYGGEPIWVTAEKQDVRTASFYWVGSEAPIEGIQPSIWKKFDDSVPFESRMDSVIAWANLPEEHRPRLISWYMEEPDQTGHDFGPVSVQTREVVERLDSILGIFIEKLFMHPGSEDINLIVLSDHGMGETRPEKYIDIDENIPEEWIDYIVGYNPVVLLQPEEEYKDTVLSILKEIPNMRAWSKEEIPEHLNYGKNPRISDIVVAADSGWSIGTKEAPLTGTGGAHGYDFRNRDMHAIFYAWGPAFRENYKHPSFYNVDIYLLLAHILEIEPAETDGNFLRVQGMLRESEMYENEQ